MGTEGQKDIQVSVIVPHYNDLEALDRCLSGLTAQTFPADQVEIIVADNMSEAGLEAIEKIIAERALLVPVQQRGAGPARNGGVAASSGTILAFLDSDCRPHTDWIAQGIAGISKHDIVGGSVEVLVRDPAQITATEAFESVFAFNIENYFSRKGFVITGNLFCKRSVFDNVGSFGVGISEDVDWCHRATAKYFSIGYAPCAVVGHPARRTWPELRKKWLRIDSETYHLRVRRRSDRIMWGLLGLMLPASALFHTPRVLKANGLNWDQKLAALRVLYKLRLWRMRDYWRLLSGKPRQ